METRGLLCLDLDNAETVRSSLDIDGAARLAGTLKAFSDPTLLLIVQALAQRELCGCDLGWVTGQSDKVVSHHLGRLRREGLVAGLDASALSVIVWAASSFVEGLASIIVIWRFTGPRTLSEHSEPRRPTTGRRLVSAVGPVLCLRGGPPADRR